jgi:archaemetzincin
MFVYVVFFGNVEERLVLAVAGNVRRTFRLEVRVSSVPAPPRIGYNPARGQHHAGTVLRYLAGVAFPNLVKMVAVVDFDLYEEGLNFVFGEAELGGRNAVVSLARLKHPEERTFFSRVFKEVNHELGHCFGLRHCEDRRCVMSFSNSVAEVDQKSADFCKTCGAKLEKALKPYLKGP